MRGKGHYQETLGGMRDPKGVSERGVTMANTLAEEQIIVDQNMLKERTSLEEEEAMCKTEHHIADVQIIPGPWTRTMDKNPRTPRKFLLGMLDRLDLSTVYEPLFAHNSEKYQAFWKHMWPASC